MDRRKALSQIGFSALAGAMLLGCSRDDEATSTELQAEGEPPEAVEDDGLVDLLFVQNAFGMSYDGARLTLIDADPKTLFIDVIGRPMSPGSIAGVHRRHRRRRRAVLGPGPL